MHISLKVSKIINRGIGNEWHYKAKKVITAPIFSVSNRYNSSRHSNTVQKAGLDSKATTSIYRSESKKGKYTLVTEVNDATYEDYTEDNTKSYYYKIKVTVKSGKKFIQLKI